MRIRLASASLTIWLIFSASSLGVAGHRFDLGVFVDESSRIPFPLDSTTLVVDVELVDVDGDGDLDLWVTRGTLSGAGRNSQLWKNDGRGNFSLPKGGSQREVLDHTDTVFGDIDGDFDMDAIEAVNLGGESAKFNIGNGGFVGRKTGGLRDSSTDVTISGVLFDADGDGDLDFAEANECPPPVCTAGGAQNILWINDGLGNFRDETATRFPIMLTQSSALVSGDIDFDTDPDLIVVNGSQSGANSLVFINDGFGHFTDETLGRLPTQSLSGRDAALVDVDGDGDRDLFLVISRQQQSHMYLNTGGGVFVEVTATHLPQQMASFQEVEVIDLNNDGVVDLFYLSDVGATLDGRNHIFAGARNRLWENDGTGHFTDITVDHFPAMIDQSLSAAIGDIDRDGDFDVIVGNGKGESIKVYIQQR